MYCDDWGKNSKSKRCCKCKQEVCYQRALFPEMGIFLTCIAELDNRMQQLLIALFFFSCRYLAVGKSTRSQAVLGPENADITKDPSWVKR